MAANAGHLPRRRSGGAEPHPVRHGDPATQVEQRFRLIAYLGAATALATGIVVLVGWALGIPVLKSVVPGLVTMRANTALAFVLAGLALGLLIDERSNKLRMGAVRFFSVAVAAIGVLTLFEYASGINLRIDTALFLDSTPAGSNSIPGRMALVTALCASLLGIALAGVSSGRAATQKVAQALLVVVFSLGLMASIGYAYSVSALYGVAGYSQMAIHTALGFSMASVGALAARPRLGFMRVLSQANSAGSTARRLIFIMGVAPVLIGWVRLYGQHAGYYGTEFGLAVMVLVNVGLLVAVVLWNGRVQGAAEAERDGLVEELRVEHASLEYQVIVRTRELSDSNAKLQEAERRFEAMVSNIPGVVFQMRMRQDGTRYYSYMGGQFLDALGISKTAAESNAAVIDDRLLEVDEAQRMELLRRSMETMGPYEHESRMRAADGSHFWVRTTGTPHGDANGETVWDGITMDITASKRQAAELLETHGQLVESERRFRAIVNNIPGVVYQMRMRPDGSLYYSFVSEAIRQMLGVGDTEVMANAVLADANFLPEDELVRKESLRRSMDTMQPLTREFRVRVQDGSLHWWRTYSSPNRGANDETVWDGITLDVTAEKKREEELRASKELVTLITQTIPGIVFRREIKADGSPSYTYFAGQLLEAFQITEQDALQNPAKLFDLIHPDDRAPMIQSLDPAVEDLRPRTFVIRLINPAGGTRWIEIQSRAEQKPDGRIFRNGIMVDVTLRKEAEAALEASERRYRAVINNAPGVVFQQRKSREGKVSFTFFSEQLQAVMGITPSEALTNSSRFDALFHPEELEIRKRYLKESAANMSLREVDLRFMHPDGTYHWLHTRAIPHLEADGAILWDGLAHDITDRHNLEDSLRHAERLQAIAQLSDGVAHHFNNLLAIIAGNVELLALDSIPESGRKDLITKIETAVSRGARVVDELREFSRYDVLQSGVVPVHKLLQQMHNLAMPATGSGIQLQLEVAPGLWGASVDRSRLQTAMLNLLFNARDAMPRGGSVVIAARNLPLDAEAAGALRLQPGSYIELSVKDNGVGMTHEVQEHALNPFFTTKAPGQGVGLGLSMVHRFATQSGGAVSLHSTPGVGTEVRLLLPASPEAGRAA